MPTDLQTVSPVNAARREFGLRGGLSMQLDETIAPTVVAGESLAAPPWRTDGKNWFASTASIAVVGQLAWHGVAVRQAGLIAVIDRLIIANGAGAGISVTLGQFATTPAYGFITTGFENLGAGLNFDVQPIAVWAENNAAPGIALTWGTLVLAGNSSLIVDPVEPIVLNLGNGINQGFGLLSTVVNQALTVSWYGRSWYDR
jgi:hypothetical protein